ncbi:MAG: DUF4198 domain-containing protein [Planctomycetes bacterium]|nr:DUF4198 domain-containing protein [Planctomycetota bacterium]
MFAAGSSSRFVRALGVAIMLLTGLASSGCGKKAKPQSITGQVLIEGKPLAQAQIVLVPIGDKVKPDAPRPSGFSDEEGRFQLSTVATEGEYAVLVQWHPLVELPGQEVQAGPNVLHARFADPDQTPLRVSVAKGTSELQPFEVSRN